MSVRVNMRRVIAGIAATAAAASVAAQPASAGGWVGLSELTPAGDGTLLVVERDNQRGATAEVKKVYRIDTAAVAPATPGEQKPLVPKEFVVDLLPALRAGGGEVADKVEGLALLGGAGHQAELVGVVDNDGLDDAPGESVFLRLGRLGRA